MNKSELRKENRKTKAGRLQKVSWFALMLICIEIIVWSKNGMSPALLVAILATCAVEVTCSAVSLKELRREKKEMEQ